MKTILVTGGAGFIASHITDFLLSSGYKVRVLDNFYTGFKENLEFGAYFPFYMGQNKCLGDNFANLEMRIILLKIANKMDLSLKSKFPEPKFATLLKIKNQVVMTVNKENDEGLD